MSFRCFCEFVQNILKSFNTPANDLLSFAVFGGLNFCMASNLVLSVFICVLMSLIKQFCPYIVIQYQTVDTSLVIFSKQFKAMLSKDCQAISNGWVLNCAAMGHP